MMSLTGEVGPRTKPCGKAQKEERQPEKYERKIGHSGHDMVFTAATPQRHRGAGELTCIKSRRKRRFCVNLGRPWPPAPGAA